MTDVLTTRGELAEARTVMTGRVGVVMTMGALHGGHAALLRAARTDYDTVLATIFVNPLQFGPSEDFARYPRTLEADLEVLRAEGTDAVFVPSSQDMYPNGEPQVRLDPGPLGTVLEGAHRPGHFAGVLTVVAKLLHLTRPDAAFFGEKDYQQLVLIRTMVGDLDLPVRVVGVPTVREPDGLALSSRNRYLSTVDSEAALALSRALRAGAEAAGDAPTILAAAHKELDAVAAVAVDYLELTNPELGPAPARGPARLLVAARVGGTRLIDNRAVEIA
jgi:pantoate--beta-alanine ligase